MIRIKFIYIKSGNLSYRRKCIRKVFPSTFLLSLLFSSSWPSWPSLYFLFSVPTRAQGLRLHLLSLTMSTYFSTLISLIHVPSYHFLFSAPTCAQDLRLHCLFITVIRRKCQDVIQQKIFQDKGLTSMNRLKWNILI